MLPICKQALVRHQWAVGLCQRAPTSQTQHANVCTTWGCLRIDQALITPCASYHFNQRLLCCDSIYAAHSKRLLANVDQILFIQLCIIPLTTKLLKWSTTADSKTVKTVQLIRALSGGSNSMQCVHQDCHRLRHG